MINTNSVMLNLSDLNSYKDELPKEVRDSIERVTDDVKEILETINDFKNDFN